MVKVEHRLLHPTDQDNVQDRFDEPLFDDRTGSDHPDWNCLQSYDSSSRRSHDGVEFVDSQSVSIFRGTVRLKLS